MKRPLFIAFAALFVFITVSGTQDGTKEFDLSDKGIPVTVTAPSDAQIEEGLMHGEVMDGVETISWELNSGSFSLEVMMDDEEMWQTAAEYLGDSKDFVETDEDFGGYIEEDENGFICKYDYEEGVMYEFYYQLVKGDRIIEFSAGMSSDDSSLSEVRRMYQAAKSAK